MRQLRATIERVASTDFTVLLEGESGVGKELVARQIHELSRRRGGPFVAINCAALVETLLEAELFGIEERTATASAGGGESSKPPTEARCFSTRCRTCRCPRRRSCSGPFRIWRSNASEATATHRVDIRIIAATNRRLLGLVDRQLFRSDLYYRLSGVDVFVPALRERKDDITELARYFLERHRSTRPLRLSAAAIEALETYHWPGNVRELERLIERAVALTESDVIELDDLPATVSGDHAVILGPSLNRDETLRAWGSRYARIVVNRCQGNKRQACRVLGISYHTLQAYLRYPADVLRAPQNRPCPTRSRRRSPREYLARLGMRTTLTSPRKKLRRFDSAAKRRVSAANPAGRDGAEIPL